MCVFVIGGISSMLNTNLTLVTILVDRRENTSGIKLRIKLDSAAVTLGPPPTVLARNPRNVKKGWRTKSF